MHCVNWVAWERADSMAVTAGKPVESIARQYGRKSSHGGGIGGEALQCLGNDDARGRHADFTGDLVDSNSEDTW